MSDDVTSAGLAVYMRVSTQLQARRGAIETQRPDIDRYLAAYNTVPYAWYEDEAVSGRWVPFAKRPQGRRLLADANAGYVKLVLVWRLDRFGRNAVEILQAVKELEDAGARLISLKEQFDTRTAAGRLMLGVLASVAEFEWESILERSVAGVDRKLDGGGWMGGRVPYGYKVEGTRPNSHLVIDDDPLELPGLPPTTAADVIRLIYRLYTEEGQTTVTLAERLNTMGVPTAFTRRAQRFHRGERDEPAMSIWRPNNVRHILINPVYKGEYLFGRRNNNHAPNGERTPRKVVAVQVPAIVSVETWDAAQATLERNLIFSPRNAKRDYLLRGLITCGVCGHGYIGDISGAGPRYVCYAARRPQILFGTHLSKERRCMGLPVRAADIEADIWADVEKSLREPGPVLAELAAQLSGNADQSADIRANLAAKQQEQMAKQQEKDAILAYFRKGRISERDVDRQLDDIAREEVELAKDIAALSKQLEMADDQASKLAGAEALLRELGDILDSEPLTPALRRQFLERMVSSIVVHRELDEQGEPRAVVKVRYCYQPPEDNGITNNIGKCVRSPDKD